MMPRSCEISRIAVFSRLRMSLQQRQHLRLDRHVERGGRLVRDQQARIAGQRHRDHHALAHAAGELVRIGVDARRRIRNADEPQHLQDLLAPLGPAHRPVQHDRLGDLVADGHHRVQRAHRLLEDHRDVAAADVGHVVARQRPAGSRRRTGCVRRRSRPGGSGISRRIDSDVIDLPEPDSPTMPDRAAGLDLEADVVDHADRIGRPGRTRRRAPRSSAAGALTALSPDRACRAARRRRG